MRLVVDTNILISVLLSSTSLPAKIVLLWLARRFDLLTAPEQAGRDRTRHPISQNSRALNPDVALRLVNDLRALAITLSPLPLVEASPDPDDNDPLAIAVAGSADFLLTGSKRDLLGLGTHAGTNIVSVRDFLALHGTHT